MAQILNNNPDLIVTSDPGTGYCIIWKIPAFRQGISYKRRLDLEEQNCHVIIIDVAAKAKMLIINLYRSFRPPDGDSATNFFARQLRLVKNALCTNCFVMGDFNLDGGNDIRPDYSNRHLLDSLKTFAIESNLLQIVDFNTWSRTINGVKKESLLDHI